MMKVDFIDNKRQSVIVRSDDSGVIMAEAGVWML